MLGSLARLRITVSSTSGEWRSIEAGLGSQKVNLQFSHEGSLTHCVFLARGKLDDRDMNVRSHSATRCSFKLTLTALEV